MDTTSMARACSYLAGVLVNQQRDPLCSRCKAFANTVQAAREILALSEARELESHAAPSRDAVRLLREAAALLGGLVVPSEAVGQKKAGNCLLPQGQCFVKSALAFVRGLEGPVEAG
jgi:hypothetical protein